MNLMKKLGLSLVMLAAAFCVQADTETETVNGITVHYYNKLRGFMPNQFSIALDRQK